MSKKKGKFVSISTLHSYFDKTTATAALAVAATTTIKSKISKKQWQ